LQDSRTVIAALSNRLANRDSIGMGDDEILEQKNTDRKRLWLNIRRIIVGFWNKMRRMCDREEKRREEGSWKEIIAALAAYYYLFGDLVA
jgi:hypothetical protein